MENKYSYWTLIIKYDNHITGLIKNDIGNLVSVKITPSPSEKEKYENLEYNEVMLSITKFLDGKDQVNFDYLDNHGFNDIINAIVNIGILSIEDEVNIGDRILEDPSYFNQLWYEMGQYFDKYEKYFDEFHNTNKILI